MSKDTTLSHHRDFSRVDGVRAFIFLSCLVGVGVCYWFLLPAIQSLLLPQNPGGLKGPWVIRPILAFHAGAMAVMTCVTLPFILQPLKKKFEREDAALGTQYNPFRGSPIGYALIFLKGGLLLLIYAAALMFYLFSWTVIGSDGIEQRLPWAERNYSFQDIEALEKIPDGERSDSLAKNGPWYSIEFRDGSHMTLSLDNEGITSDELNTIAQFLADRSGLRWKKRSDARVR